MGDSAGSGARKAILVTSSGDKDNRALENIVNVTERGVVSGHRQVTSKTDKLPTENGGKENTTFLQILTVIIEANVSEEGYGRVESINDVEDVNVKALGAQYFILN